MMHSYASENILDIVSFVNDNSIAKTKIVSLFQNNSGTYLLIYFD